MADTGPLIDKPSDWSSPSRSLINSNSSCLSLLGGGRGPHCRIAGQQLVTNAQGLQVWQIRKNAVFKRERSPPGRQRAFP